METIIDKDCFLPGISFSGVLPQELGDDMLYCNNSMIIIDTNVCSITCFGRIQSKMFPVNEVIKETEKSYYVQMPN